jgi:hypothetical protein
MNIILIGMSEDTNAKAHKHFKDRTASFITMTVEEAHDDLIKQGHKPIWMWDEWHTSMEEGQANENTIHVAKWDNLHTHALELKNLRFYIPYLSVVKKAKHLFFINDDLLIQQDLKEVMSTVGNKVGPNAEASCMLIEKDKDCAGDSITATNKKEDEL